MGTAKFVGQYHAMTLRKWRLLLAVVAAGFSETSVFGRNINSYAGPYIAYGKHFYNCDPGYPIQSKWYIRVSHFNPAKPKELQRVTGNLTLPSGLSDEYTLLVVIDSRSNNQWKENAFVFKLSKACSSTKLNMADAFRVLRGSNTCPIAKGTIHTFVNETVSWVFPNVPIMPYGTWRFRFLTGMDPTKRSVCCLAAECATVPKLS